MYGSPQTRNSTPLYRIGIAGGIFSSPECDLWPLLQSLPKANTLLVNVGPGNLACSRFPGPKIQVNDWIELQNTAALIGGINPMLNGDLPYSKQHYVSALEQCEKRNPLDGINTALIHGWGIQAILEYHCQGLSAWVGKEESTSCYNYKNSLLTRLLRQIFRAARRAINVWISFPLRQANDSSNLNKRLVPDLPIEVVHDMMCFSDIVASMADLWKDGVPNHALVTDPYNVWDLPVKTSAAFGLDLLEPPDLAALTNKVLASVYHRESLEPLNGVIPIISTE